MTTPRVSQLAAISVQLAPPPTIRSNQISTISVLLAPPPPIQVSQLVVIAIVGNGENFISLDNVIALDCWQPCTSYGTEGTVYYV